MLLSLVAPTKCWRMHAGSTEYAAGGHTFDLATPHLLTTSLEHSHVNQEIPQNLQSMNQELASLCGIPVVPVPIPKPAWEVQHLLLKMTADNDEEA